MAYLNDLAQRQKVVETLLASKRESWVLGGIGRYFAPISERHKDDWGGNGRGGRRGRSSIIWSAVPDAPFIQIIISGYLG